MKTLNSTIKALLILGIIFSFSGVNSVSATKAVTDKGTGCYVRIGLGESDYAFDNACLAQEVLKMDDDGNFEFYSYQDHGQLPEGSWRPARPYRETFEVCLNFDFGTVCGTANELVTPSGEYKSSFRSH